MKQQDKQYYIVNERLEYFTRNDFNGKAFFLPAKEDGTAPVIAYVRGEWEAHNKMRYLEVYGSGFKALELKPVEDEIA